MKQIKLSNGRFTITDDDCDTSIEAMNWRESSWGYAIASLPRNGGKQKIVFMHRLIAKPPIGFEVDHVNGDRLDNRRLNLRVVTRAQNSYNRFKNTNKHGFKGVHFHKTRKMFEAKIRHQGREKFIGWYTNPEEASAAYAQKAIELRGEYARW